MLSLIHLWTWVKPRRQLALDANNSPERVSFRQSILALQESMMKAAEEGKLEASVYPLRHYFTPISEKYGCAAYAREIFIPTGEIVIGKIHKHAHLNFLMKGRVLVATEFGNKQMEAPTIWISEPGTKRAVYAETDVIWVTVHLTEHVGKENLNKMEEEVIAKTYEELETLAIEEKP